ncbi:hypothetical protein IAG41_16295 [Sphingomonas sp. JC676]|nr:hypothetical protein [Sphingomonas sp. JC676]
MFGIFAMLAAQAAPGVVIDTPGQIGVATNHARCIVRAVGRAPADAAARAAKVQAAVTQCRSFLDADYAAGRLTLNGKPYEKGWWRKVQVTLDAVQAGVVAGITGQAQYKINWRLPDGSVVDAYDAPDPKTVQLLTVAI